MDRFHLGAYVRKRSGAFWEGSVVGHYTTAQTPDGIAVQLFGWIDGPVQIYPAAALELCGHSDSRLGAPSQTYLVDDVVSVRDEGNAITLYFAEIKSAKAFRDAFSAKAVGLASEGHVAGGAGFEPALPFGRTEYQSAAFNHSATPVDPQEMAGAADLFKTPPPSSHVALDAAARLERILRLGRSMKWTPNGAPALDDENTAVALGELFQIFFQDAVDRALATTEGSDNG